MNRTDRLHALAEEMRAASPRPVSSRHLAHRFGVSLRTIERDLLALQQAGVPIWAEQARRGRYVLDAHAALPPVSFTTGEARAVVTTLARVPEDARSPDVGSALAKVRAALPVAATPAVVGPPPAAAPSPAASPPAPPTAKMHPCD